MSDDDERTGSDDDILGTPEDAFAALGDETRLEILLALAESVNNGEPETGLSFSELRKRVGVKDSGRFNYHLEKLSGGFIKNEDGEYLPRFPGLAVVSAVYAGAFGGGAGEHETAAEWECPKCDQQLTIHYDDDVLQVKCEDHELLLSYPAPPGAFSGRSLQELTTVVVVRALTNMELARQGICPRCWGQTDVDFPVEPPEGGVLTDEEAWVRIACTRCWLQYSVPFQTIVSGHPAVRAFYTEHGFDQAETLMGPRPTSDPDVCTAELADTDPPTASIRITLDDELLLLELDEACTVLDQRREES